MHRFIFSIIFLGIFFTLSTALPVYADDNSSTETNGTEIEDANKIPRPPLRNVTWIMKQKEERKEAREEIKEVIKQKREELKTITEQKREQFKNRIEQIKDEHKQMLGNRIDQNLSKINQNHTDRLSLLLDKLQQILDRLSGTVEALKATGIDISTAETAILDAQDAINKAKEAVATQAAKEYIANVTDDSSMHQGFSEVIQQLKTDLKTVRQTIADAAKAVRNAAAEIRKLKSDNSSPSAAVSD